MNRKLNEAKEMLEIQRGILDRQIHRSERLAELTAYASKVYFTLSAMSKDTDPVYGIVDRNLATPTLLKEAKNRVEHFEDLFKLCDDELLKTDNEIEKLEEIILDEKEKPSEY